MPQTQGSVSVAQVVQLVISGFINVPLCMDGQRAKLAFSFSQRYRSLIWSHKEVHVSQRTAKSSKARFLSVISN